MDPYIEDPEVWSDFHGRLAEEISAALNQVLQPRYVARLTPRVTYEVVEIGERHSVRPDVPMELPLRLYTVEVRETAGLRPGTDRRLVAAIEVLSPVNQRPGHEAYHDYLRKRHELLRCDAHLIEIDLLRGGQRPPLERPVPPAPYYVTLSRAGRRPYVEVWPVQLREKLPVLPVPLLEPDPDVPLDLGAVVAAVYQRGAYARLIDYRQPPPAPPLSEAETAWVEERLGAEKTP
jgi:hypothetical protein